MRKVQKLRKFLFRHPKQVKEDIHDFFVGIALRYYENWVLPKQTISLRDLKIREFEDRKKLVHPYTKDSFIAENIDNDSIVALQRKVRMSNMHTFTLTYDRHEGRYEYKLKDFPDSYPPVMPFYEFLKDPDWLYKMKYRRFNGKYLSFVILFFVWYFFYFNNRTK